MTNNADGIRVSAAFHPHNGTHVLGINVDGAAQELNHVFFSFYGFAVEVIFLAHLHDSKKFYGCMPVVQEDKCRGAVHVA